MSIVLVLKILEVSIYLPPLYVQGFPTLPFRNRANDNKILLNLVEICLIVAIGQVLTVLIFRVITRFMILGILTIICTLFEVIK
jgi:hypothetical protein